MMTEVVLVEKKREGQPGVTDRLLEIQDNRGLRSYVVTQASTCLETSDLGAAIRMAAVRMSCSEGEVEAAVRDTLDAITAA